MGRRILADPASSYDFVDRATYDAWTPKGSIQMQASRDTFVLCLRDARIQERRTQPVTTPRSPASRAFHPEFAWSYEGGLKRTMADGRVRVNTAVFYNDYQDLQVQSFLGVGVIDISNAGIGDDQRHRSRGDRGGGDAACSSRAMSPGSTRPTTAISPS